MSTKIKYTCTTLNGDILTVNSVRPIVECHVAINKETGKIGAYRWSKNKLGKASASSCGWSLGYVRGGWCKDEAKINAQADVFKASLDAKYNYYIIPVTKP